MLAWKYLVLVEWDDEAKTWVARSDDVPGLATGADTIEGLIAKIRVIVPELLELNGVLPAGSNFELPLSIQANYTERLRGHV